MNYCFYLDFHLFNKAGTANGAPARRRCLAGLSGIDVVGLCGSSAVARCCCRVLYE